MRIRMLGLGFAVAGSFGLNQALGEELNGYLTVNDEDYGYWEGRVMVSEGGEWVPLASLRGSPPKQLDVELSQDLLMGLVRQYVAQANSISSPTSNSIASASMAAAEDAAAVTSNGAASDGMEPVMNSDGSWVEFGQFFSLGFGQYEGADVVAGAYCDQSPTVWAWLGRDSLSGLTPDQAAEAVVDTGSGRTRLRLQCGGELQLSH